VPAADFKTVSDELLHVAVAAEELFGNEGYAVSIERRELGFPLTPALVCRRNHETVIVEVASTLDKALIDRWVRYCRSQTVDTRFCIFVRTKEALSQTDLAFAQANRLGLFVHDDINCMEIRAPSDLAVHVELPDLALLPKAIRPHVASAFRKVRENDWRDGLNDAYNEVEQLAREYLKSGIESGRVTIMTGTKKTGPRPLTTLEVDKMTLGQLKDQFPKIQNQNHKDSVIGNTLAMINKTRVGLAHRRRSKAVEAQLRLEVGQHMYAVTGCLEELLT
jgi:hypothetical protein